MYQGKTITYTIIGKALLEYGGKTGVQKAWPSKALPITFRMENKGKLGLSALVNGEGIRSPTRQRKKGQAYVAGGEVVTIVLAKWLDARVFYLSV